MEEIWKDIIDERLEEGKYEVSNFGVVRFKVSKRLKAIQDNGGGYKKCAFALPGHITVNRYIHRLVAKAFLENPDNLPQVGHKDHDKENNFVGNLYWTSQSQNTRDGVEAGRINAKKRGKTNQLTTSQIREIAFKRFGGMGVNDIAISMSLPRTTVSSVINGRSHWPIYCAAAKEVAACVGELERRS